MLTRLLLSPQALYENMLVELPFAGFFLSKLLGTSADVDIHHLASLDPEVYRTCSSSRATRATWRSWAELHGGEQRPGEAQASGAGPCACATLQCALADTPPPERPRQVGPSHLGVPVCTRWTGCGACAHFS